LQASPTPLGEGFTACAFNKDIINFGTAENLLLGDYLCSLLRSQPDQVATNLTSQAALSDLPLRGALADLYEDYFGIAKATPNHFVFGCGVSFLIERLGLVFCNPGDIVLIPKPCYGSFARDLQMSGAEVVYIDLQNLPPAPPPTAKMLILTNPGNPIGDIIGDQAGLLAWAYRVPDLHIITDDIYALSNRKGEKYHSIAGRRDAKPERVHQVYGVSKDWGLAGMHVGFFWTRDEAVYRVVKEACRTYRLPSDTVIALTKLFGNKILRDEIIGAYKVRLIESERITIEKLTEAGIGIVRADSSLFVMIDMSDVGGESEEREVEVFRELLYKYRVHVIPGYTSFHWANPGWYRLCFPTPEPQLVEGLDRLINRGEDILSSSRDIHRNRCFSTRERGVEKSVRYSDTILSENLTCEYLLILWMEIWCIKLID
jgi:aspartate/methionine/tyrosine aminotransferase